MEKLFDAIRNQHPGCEVVDVRFLVNLGEINDQDVSQLDVDLAAAIECAEKLPTPQ